MVFWCTARYLHLSQDYTLIIAMTKEHQKQALGTVWALVYRATQVPYLRVEQTEKLHDALDVLAMGLIGDDFFNRRASFVRDCVFTCGVISKPSRPPDGAEQIMEECQTLQRHLDRQ